MRARRHPPKGGDPPVTQTRSKGRPTSPAVHPPRRTAAESSPTAAPHNKGQGVHHGRSPSNEAPRRSGGNDPEKLLEARSRFPHPPACGRSPQEGIWTAFASTPIAPHAGIHRMAISLSSSSRSHSPSHGGSPSPRSAIDTNTGTPRRGVHPSRHGCQRFRMPVPPHGEYTVTGVNEPPRTSGARPTRSFRLGLNRHGAESATTSSTPTPTSSGTSPTGGYTAEGSTRLVSHPRKAGLHPSRRNPPIAADRIQNTNARPIDEASFRHG